MNTQAKKIIAGTLLIATSTLMGVATTSKPAEAMMIGGGGTCTPHEVTYQQYISGHYNEFNNWIPSHYETRTRMSTECNSGNNPIPPTWVNLGGSWYTNANNSNAPTQITQNGPTSYILTNEQGSSSSAYRVGNQIFAPQWQVSGYLENGNRAIAWSNGTQWSRYPTNNGINFNVTLPLGHSFKFHL